MQARGLPSRPQDRLAWLWLAIGASLLPFAMFQAVWPIAAWLSPVLLMRFSRTQRLAVGLPLICLALCLGFAVGDAKRAALSRGAPDAQPPPVSGGGIKIR